MRKIKDFLKRHFPEAARRYHRIRTTTLAYFELPKRLYVDETNISVPAHNWPVYALVAGGSRLVKNEKRFYYEEEIIACFKERMEKGGIFFDIGAGIGYWSYVAVFLGAKKAYAFEPIRGFAEVIRKTSKEQNLPIEVVRNPLGESGKDVILDNPHASPSRVIGTSIDDFVASTGAIPTSIKIDVDGNEPAIVRGAMGVLSTYHPELFLEVRPETMGLISQLGSIGYKEVKRFGSDSIVVVLTARP